MKFLSMTSLDNLPLEILTEIILNLDHSTRLATITLFKSWFYALYPSLWNKTICHLNDWEFFKKRFKRQQFTDYRNSIRILHFISHSISIQSRVPNVKIVLQGCKNLTEFVFEVPSFNDDDIWLLVTFCKNLTKLSLISSSTKHGKISDEGLLTLVNLKNLKHLMLKYLSLECISERGLLAIANGFQGQLLTFGLEYQDHNDYETMAVGGLAQNTFPTRLEGYVDPAELKKRFVDGLVQIIESHKNLQRLALDWPVDDTLVLQSVGKLRDLQVLKLGNSSAIQQLETILSNNLNLKRVSLFEVNLLGHEISQVLRHCTPELTHLEIHGVCQFISCVEMIPTFRFLESLVFSPTTRSATLNPLNVISMDLIAQQCRLLKRVEVPIHDNQSLISFATYCPLITVLGIQDGRAIDQHGLTIMCTRLKLEYLNLGHAVVNQVAIGSIVKYLGPSLKQLILSTPTRLTEEQFMMICQGCPHLRVLGNVGSDVSFPVLLNGIPLLTKLSELALGIRRGTPTLSRQQIDLLKQKQKSLKHVSLYS
jgi:hypothetical protein